MERLREVRNREDRERGPPRRIHALWGILAPLRAGAAAVPTSPLTAVIPFVRGPARATRLAASGQVPLGAIGRGSWFQASTVSSSAQPSSQVFEVARERFFPRTEAAGPLQFQPA